MLSDYDKIVTTNNKDFAHNPQHTLATRRESYPIETKQSSARRETQERERERETTRYMVRESRQHKDNAAITYFDRSISKDLRGREGFAHRGAEAIHV